MSIKLRRRGLIVLTAVASCVLAAVCLLGVVAVKTHGTARPDIHSRELTAVDLTTSEALSADQWELVFADQTMELSRREWESDNANLLLVKAWRHSGPIAAEYSYFSDRVKPRYERQYSGYVEDYEPPATGADRESLFCGHVGRSVTDQIEACTIWGYWARYGQYVVYLEVYGLPMPLDDFRSLVESYDHHILALFESA